MQPQLEPYVGISSITKILELQQYLNEQVFSLKDLGLPPKTVTHWDNSGLGNIKRQDSSEWRRLSFLEFTWMQFINELRSLGIPVKTVLRVKDQLLSKLDHDWIVDLVRFHHDKADNPDLRNSNTMEALEGSYVDIKHHIDLFTLLVVGSIVQRSPVSVLVFLDGTMVPLFRENNEHWSEELILKRDWEGHAVIPLTGLFKKFISNPRTLFSLPKLNLLNESEQYLLTQIHSGKYSKITINFKDSKLKSLELVKDQDVKARISDVLADASYQDITIKTHQGMVTKIENTVKVFL